MLFKLKPYTNTALLRPVYFALFYSYLTYSMFNWERANKTTLLAVIKLQKKAVRHLDVLCMVENIAHLTSCHSKLHSACTRQYGDLEMAPHVNKMFTTRWCPEVASHYDRHHKQISIFTYLYI